MIGLVSLAAAFPLDIPLDEHLAELRACDDGDAEACMRLANASGRAFVASIAAHARGTASFDLQRNAEMSMFVQAACAAGSLDACHLADDPAGACRLKDPEGCTELLGDGPAAALFTCVGACDTPLVGPFRSGNIQDGLVVSSPSTMMGPAGKHWGRQDAEGRFLWLDDGRVLFREERSKPGAQWERPVRYTWFGPQGVEVTEVQLASVPTWRAARPSDGSELVVLEGAVFLVDPASGDVRRILDGSALSATWSAGGGAVVTQDSIVYLDRAGEVLETVDRDGATVAWGAGGLRPVFANRIVTLGGEELCRPRVYEGFAVDPNGRWAACLDRGFFRVFDESGSPIANMQVGVTQFVQPIDAHSWGLAWRDIRLLTAPAPEVPPSRWEPPLPPTLAPGRRSVSARLSDGSSGVTVYAVPAGDPLTWQRAPEALHVREAVTDASGTVRFDSLAAGVWALWVDGARVTYVREGDTEIDLDRPKQITRRDVNAGLRGGVVVSSSLGSMVEASIGSDGAWEIQTRGTTRLRSCAPGRPPTVPGVQNPKPGAAERATLVLERADGTPVPDVYLEPYGLTDAKGRLDVRCFVGEPTLDVHGVSAVLQPFEGDLRRYVLRTSRVSPVELRAKCKVAGDPACAHPTTTVRVVDATGHPAARAVVRFAQEGHGKAETYQASMMGELHLHDDPPGRRPVDSMALEDGVVVRRTPSERMLARPEGQRCDSGVRVQSDDDKHYIDTPPIDEVLCPPGPVEPRTDRWWEDVDLPKALQGEWVAVTANTDAILAGRQIAAEKLADETPRRLPAAIAVLGLEPAVAAHAYGWGLKQYRRQSDDGFELPLPHAGELILTRRIAKTADTPARHQPLAAVLQTEDGTLGPLWLADPDTLVWFGGTQRVWFEFPSVQEQWTVFQRRRPDDRRE